MNGFSIGGAGMARVDNRTLVRLASGAIAARNFLKGNVPMVSPGVLRRQVMAAPPTVGAGTTSTGIASGVTWPSVVGGSAAAVLPDHFTYSCAGSPIQRGTSYPDYNYIKFNSLTTTNGSASYRVDFMHGGTALEILHKGTVGSILIMVDGQYVSLTPVSVPNDGATYYQPVTFASAQLRRITLFFAGVVFGGVRTGLTDTVTKAPLTGPRCIVVGDSFTEGTGATGGANTNWVRSFADHIGWEDVWSSGVGGTGYLNPGTGGRVKFRDRIINDVINYAAEVVIFAGGINDSGTYTPADIGAEALILFQQVKAALPNAVIIVLSPFWRNGVSTFQTNFLATRDALKVSCLAVGGTFIDLLEMPLDMVAPSTTLSASSLAGATTISTAAALPGRAVIEVEGERRVITACSGAGPFTVTVAPGFTNAHASGVAANVVGPCFWTGTGKSGSPASDGNSDVYVSSDGTHPSQAGHDALGQVVAALVCRQLFTN